MSAEAALHYDKTRTSRPPRAEPILMPSASMLIRPAFPCGA